MAGPLQSRETRKKVKVCVCKECPHCHEKNCVGCESPKTNKMACIICYPHSPNFLRLSEEVYA